MSTEWKISDLEGDDLEIVRRGEPFLLVRTSHQGGAILDLPKLRSFIEALSRFEAQISEPDAIEERIAAARQDGQRAERERVRVLARETEDASDFVRGLIEDP